MPRIPYNSADKKRFLPNINSKGIQDLYYKICVWVQKSGTVTFLIHGYFLNMGTFLFAELYGMYNARSLCTTGPLVSRGPRHSGTKVCRLDFTFDKTSERRRDYISFAKENVCSETGIKTGLIHFSGPLTSFYATNNLLTWVILLLYHQLP